MSIRPISALAFVAALGLGACGSSGGSSSATATEVAKGASSVPAAKGFNDADVLFAQSMIPHHEQAIEMAEIALDPKVAAGPRVKDLATRIKSGQDPEIAQMTAWMTAWGKPMQMDSGGGHDMSAMQGMMSAGDMDALGAATGPAFDKMWSEMMLRHHEGAIAMAQTVKAAGSNPEVLALSGKVIAAQQGEITELKGLIAG